jgi:hypothetical protein
MKSKKRTRKIVVKKRPEELDSFIAKVKAGIEFRKAQADARSTQYAAEADARSKQDAAEAKNRDTIHVDDIPEHVIAMAHVIEPGVVFTVEEPDEPEKKSWLDRLEAWLTQKGD